MGKVKRKKLFSSLVIIFLILTACSEKPPIPEEKFIKVYVDMLVIQDTTTANNFSIDSAKAIVLTRHNISEQEYDDMISYYNSEPEKWITFFDSATAYVEGLKKNAENQP